MDINDRKYARYAIIREMLATVQVISGFDSRESAVLRDAVKKSGRFFMTGEGSSRIFPAKNCIYQNLLLGSPVQMMTEGGCQSKEYDLKDFVVCAASNSGRTKEIVDLFNILKKRGHKELYGISANAGTPVVDLAKKGFILRCGKEEAVAATKSVVEQALFYHSIVNDLSGETVRLSENFEQVLSTPIDQAVVEMLARSETIYFAGRNNGVAEELALKANEITRKRSGYLEGTYAVHGIEESMRKDETVVIIEPFESEMEKFKEVLVDGVGMNVIAVSTKNTPFHTIIIPDMGNLNPYLELAAGWSLLVETGLALKIDLDRPVRARKVGNLFKGE